MREGLCWENPLPFVSWGSRAAFLIWSSWPSGLPTYIQCSRAQLSKGSWPFFLWGGSKPRSWWWQPRNKVPQFRCLQLRWYTQKFHDNLIHVVMRRVPSCWTLRRVWHSVCLPVSQCHEVAIQASMFVRSAGPGVACCSSPSPNCTIWSESLILICQFLHPGKGRITMWGNNGYVVSKIFCDIFLHKSFRV